MTSTRSRFIALIAALVLVPTAGCNLLLGVEDLTQSEADASVDVDAPPGQVSIRFVNVVRDFPGGGTVDVYVGDETTARITALRDVSDYVVVDPSTTKISIRQQGQSGGAPLHEFTDLILTGDTKVTAIIAGVNASQSTDDRVRLLPFVEDFAQAGTGQAQVRFVHAVSDVTDIGIDVGLNNEAAPEVTGLTRFSASSAGGMAATAGRPLRMGIVTGGSTFAAFAATGLELGKGCFVILSGQRSATFGANQSMTSTTVCSSRTPTVSALGARVAISHVVSDATNCSVTDAATAIPIISSVGLRQFGTIWTMAEDDVVGLALSCGGQSYSLDVPPDAANTTPKVIVIAGGSFSPFAPDQTSIVQEVPIPTTGARHAYFVNLTADINDATLLIDGTDVVGGGLLEGQTVGPLFGQTASVLAPGSHTVSIVDSVTTNFTVAGGTGGAVLYVFEGARVPQGTQRPLRLTPFDLGTSPPTAGSSIAAN